MRIARRSWPSSGSTEPVRAVCVFTGSSPGASPRYAEVAAALGRTLARRRMTLVYGGANVGLMGVLADAALAGGGEVIGVIPRGVLANEVAHTALTELRVVDSMHERKAQMAELCDGVVALPGGFGTLDELFEMVTWGQIGLHAKPCALLDVDGYFDPLRAFLDRAVEQRFISEAHRALLLHGDEADGLLDRMARHSAPGGQKWLDREPA